MTETGTYRTCSGTTGATCLANPGLGEIELPYGQDISLGPFRCISSTAGMTCMANGTGFQISRSGIVPAATTAPSQVANQVVVTPCGYDPVIKPSSIVLACADGNAQVVNLTWSSWGSSEAMAAGDYAVNDCVPTCVGGKFRQYPATIILANVKTIQGRQYFTTLTVQFTAESPSNARTLEYPLDTP
jgi:hypothetical protein